MCRRHPGPKSRIIKRKKTIANPSKVVLNAYECLPNKLLEQHQNVTLVVVNIYVNEIPFMITTSCTIHFGREEMIKMKNSTMMTSHKQIINAYSARGYIIKHILADRQFECLRKTLEIQGIILNKGAYIS